MGENEFRRFLLEVGRKEVAAQRRGNALAATRWNICAGRAPDGSRIRSATESGERAKGAGFGSQLLSPDGLSAIMPAAASKTEPRRNPKGWARGGPKYQDSRSDPGSPSLT